MRINPLNLHTLLLPKWFSRTQKTLRQGYLKKESRHKNVKKKKTDKKKKKKTNKHTTQSKRIFSLANSHQPMAFDHKPTIA